MYLEPERSWWVWRKKKEKKTCHRKILIDMENIHNVLSWKIHSLNLDQVSKFNQQLTGSTGERGTCSMMPWEYNQQNPDFGKLYRTTSSVSSTNTSEGEREKWEGVGRERELKHEKRFKRYINLLQSIALYLEH